MYTRKSAYAGDGTLNDQNLKWYAWGVRLLMARPITDPTSWWFLAAIHGIDVNLWKQLGYLSSNAELPPTSVQAKYWNQCQHATWYFLPWHRGYIAAVEANLRAAIATLPNSPSDWALPYWNYSDTSDSRALTIPPAFTAQQLPNPNGPALPNPLLIQKRYGAMPLPKPDVSLNYPLSPTQFTGVDGGGNPGFGGGVTTFIHFGSVAGTLEDQPHNVVHVDIGGRGGLMSNPNTAAIDPIFYLHHANIDRLWEVWLKRNTGNLNPTDQNWLAGPANRHFIAPMPPNGVPWSYDAFAVTPTTRLNYIYDNTQDPLQSVSVFEIRRTLLGKPPTLDFWMRVPMKKNSAKKEKANVELIGANREKMLLVGKSLSTNVKLDKRMMKKTAKSFTEFAASDSGAQEPDRIYLNLENIRSNIDGEVIDVYVNLPENADPDQHPELHVGAVGLFGIRNASVSDKAHGGAGMTKVFNITHIMDAIHVDKGDLDLSELMVSLVPRTALTEEDKVTVDRISIYREGQ